MMTLKLVLFALRVQIQRGTRAAADMLRRLGVAFEQTLLILTGKSVSF